MLESLKLKEYAKSIGVDLIGIAAASRLDSAPSGHKPEDFLPGCKSIISIAVKLNKGAINHLPKTRDEYMLEFTYGNANLYRLSQQVTRYLEDNGFESIGFTPDLASSAMIADISHKHIAVACGLGKFGLNELLVTPEYKSAVRLASIITTAEFDMHDEMLDGDTCNLCKECLKICPTRALDLWKEKGYTPETGYTIEKERCSYYQNTIMGGKRCGLCVKACQP